MYVQNNIFYAAAVVRICILLISSGFSLNKTQVAMVSSNHSKASRVITDHSWQINSKLHDWIVYTQILCDPGYDKSRLQLFEDEAI